MSKKLWTINQPVTKESLRRPISIYQERSIYLAGIVDADGAIMIRKNTRNGYSNYIEVVEVSMATPQIPEILKETYGGYFKCVENKIGLKRLLYRWVGTGERASVFLNDIYPYLVIKKGHAELCMKLRERKYLPRTRPLKKSESEIREKLFQKIKSIQLRGGENYVTETLGSSHS